VVVGVVAAGWTDEDIPGDPTLNSLIDPLAIINMIPVMVPARNNAKMAHPREFNSFSLATSPLSAAPLICIILFRMRSEKISGMRKNTPTMKISRTNVAIANPITARILKTKAMRRYVLMLESFAVVGSDKPLDLHFQEGMSFKPWSEYARRSWFLTLVF
jgi:hypothetical protein